jgi:hypothetical protein
METIRVLFETCPHIREKVEKYIEEKREKDSFNFVFKRDKLGEDEISYLRWADRLRKQNEWKEIENIIQNKLNKTQTRTRGEHNYISLKLQNGENIEKYSKLMKIHKLKYEESCRKCQENMHLAVRDINKLAGKRGYYLHWPNNLCRFCIKRRERSKK